MKPDIAALEKIIREIPEVVAAYLFGSAAREESVVNDMDLLVLLRPHVNAYEAHFELRRRLAEALSIFEDQVDVLIFDLEQADPAVLFRAISEGILLKNEDPDLLGDKIDALSRYFLENEPMIRRAKRLRKERLEAFCAD